MAKKIPSNFYQEVNVRKLDRVFSNEGDVPTPSVSDEGKVIKVNNEGKYALLPDGGAQTMTVTFTYDETTNKYSANKTHAEIIAAINSGVIVFGTYDGRLYTFAGINDISAFDEIYFSYTQSDSSDQMLEKVFAIDKFESIVFSNHDIAEQLPIVDSSDNGKVLQVVNGNWAATTITSNSEPVVKFILNTLSNVNVNTSGTEYDYITMYAENISVNDYEDGPISDALTNGVNVDLNTKIVIDIEYGLVHCEFNPYEITDIFKINNIYNSNDSKLISIISNSSYGLNKNIGYGNIKITYKSNVNKYYISIEIHKATT